MYIELKTHAGGHNDRGPARIGRVVSNRTGTSGQRGTFRHFGPDILLVIASIIF